MNRLQAKLRQIENQLFDIEQPVRCSERTVMQKHKTKEAIALSEKVHEAQKIIDAIEDQDMHYEMQRQLNKLEQWRQYIILPIDLVVECDYCE